MISVHYYDPWDFTGTEDGTITQWGPAATNPAKKSTWGQEDFLDAQLKKMHDKFVRAATRCSSVSTARSTRRRTTPSNNRYRADYARTLVATAKKYGAATAYWDNGCNGQYGFGAVRPELRHGDPAGHHRRHHGEVTRAAEEDVVDQHADAGQATRTSDRRRATASASTAALGLGVRRPVTRSTVCRPSWKRYPKIHSKLSSNVQW